MNGYFKLPRNKNNYAGVASMASYPLIDTSNNNFNISTFIQADNPVRSNSNEKQTADNFNFKIDEEENSCCSNFWRKLLFCFD